MQYGYERPEGQICSSQVLLQAICLGPTADRETSARKIRSDRRKLHAKAVHVLSGKFSERRSSAEYVCGST